MIVPRPDSVLLSSKVEGSVSDFLIFEKIEEDPPLTLNNEEYI